MAGVDLLCLCNQPHGVLAVLMYELLDEVVDYGLPQVGHGVLTGAGLGPLAHQSLVGTHGLPQGGILCWQGRCLGLCPTGVGRHTRAAARGFAQRAMLTAAGLAGPGAAACGPRTAAKEAAERRLGPFDGVPGVAAWGQGLQSWHACSVWGSACGASGRRAAGFCKVGTWDCVQEQRGRCTGGLLQQARARRLGCSSWGGVHTDRGFEYTRTVPRRQH